MARKTVAIGFLTAGFVLISSAPAYAHGYTYAPASRGYRCQQGEVTNCGAIQWEPQSVEGPKGFPSSGVRDGEICSGNNTRFRELDDPRGGRWPAASVAAGNYNFKWRFTARHRTTNWRYFITKQGWNPSAKLTRSALELTPFLTVSGNNAQPPDTVTHTGRIPSRTGRHLILAVWDIADTGNAFYSCADVTFGGAAGLTYADGASTVADSHAHHGSTPSEPELQLASSDVPRSDGLPLAAGLTAILTAGAALAMLLTRRRRT